MESLIFLILENKKRINISETKSIRKRQRKKKGKILEVH